MDDELTRRAYGGQAVFDGVLMRGATRWAVAVRRPGGDIAIDSGDVPQWSARALRIPVVRGLVALVESLQLGTKAMRWSMEQAGQLEPSGSVDERGKASSRAVAWLGAATAGLVALIVFGVGPGLVARALPFGRSGLGLSLVEAALRGTVLVTYLMAVGRVAEMRRVFQCHGAEHKAINALEAGVALDVRSASAMSTRHPRCGTTFLLVVLVVGALTHALVGHPGWVGLIVSRVVLVPVVAGLAYEVVRAAAAHTDNRWVRAVMAPGFALQGLTTRPPEPEQIEVALMALLTVLGADRSSAARVV